MTPERWQSVNELYHEAQACAPPARDAFLRARCANDEALYLEVASLLAADEKAADYLVTPALEIAAQALAAAPPPAAELPKIPSQIGSYRILSPLGRGGMGEVHLALDTRLERKVAIKLLPAEFTSNAERVHRFAREAHAVSALNHPNILTIHEISEFENTHFMVTEYVEGETLRQRMKPVSEPALTPRIKPAEAVAYAIQIAAALDAAHQAGIIHRDIKPENVMVRRDGIVKVLDFGLAKLLERDEGGRMKDEVSADLHPLSFIPHPSTSPGLVLGTPRYMSPEQARGEKVDARTDIFSLGVLLYEMIAGRAPFVGATPSETIAAILRDDPPELSETNPTISPQLARIVRHCLEKQPELRFQSARDLGFALEALSTPSGGRLETLLETAGAARANVGGNKQRLGWLVAAAFLLGMLGFAYFRRAPAARPLTFTYLPVPENTTSTDASGAVLSPDGRHLVTTAVTNGVNRLWLYSFDAPTPRLLLGTEGGHLPFWSPDSQSIGFFDYRNLKRIDLAGGLLTTLCPAPIGTGGTWNNRGEIIFATLINGSGLYRVSATGGAATSITNLDATRFETGHNSPHFLPDGRHFIFFVQAGQPDYRGIRLGSLDDTQTRFLLPADAKAEYSAAGFLLFVRGRKILAQPFDAAKLALSGEPLPITPEPIYYEPPFRYADLSVVSDQWLLYRSGGNPNTQLTWLDRNGRQLAAVCDPGQYRSMQLSPSGRQVMLDRNDPQVETSDIWKFDLAQQTGTRLTSNPGVDTYPIWSPDESRIVFVSNRDGVWGIYEKSANGDDNEQLLLKGDQQLLFTSDWSPDGKLLVYRQHKGKTRVDIELLPLLGDRAPRSYLATEFTETYGSISPDGRWLAYQSDASDNRLEIFVQSFPEPGRKVRVSQSGGQLARWRRDGKELYYMAADDKLMAVPVQTGTSFTAGAPVALFELGSYGRRTDRYMYDVSPDGQKFLVIHQLEDASMRPLTLVQNWTGLLKK
jgi:Tol biopolymer transport system component